MSRPQPTASQPSLGEDFEQCEPLFRWAGGKRRLLSQILPFVPKAYNRYFEAFAGGAALFFELHPINALLADKNAELINCYQQVKDDPEEVIAALQKLKNTKADYYEVRAVVPRGS